jgi:RNA-binding protein
MVHIGHQGLTDTALGALDDALRTHELVKVAVARTLEATPRELARQMAESVGADVIQSIGRKVTLYRHNPDLWREPRTLPPWKG